MRVHPKVAAAMKNARKANRQSILDAIEAHRLDRIVWRDKASQTEVYHKRHVFDSAVYDLLAQGVTRVCGQPVDIWLMRFMRDHEKASNVPKK